MVVAVDEERMEQRDGRHLYRDEFVSVVELDGNQRCSGELARVLAILRSASQRSPSARRSIAPASLRARRSPTISAHRAGVVTLP